MQLGAHDGTRTCSHREHFKERCSRSKTNSRIRIQASPNQKTSQIQLGAHDGTRIRDLFLTKEVLYRLSYVGLELRNYEVHK